MQERREQERFALELASKIALGPPAMSKVFEGVTRDVSSRGAFFHLTEPIAEGAHVSLRLTLATKRLEEMTGKHGLIEVGGKVLRSNQTGIAIRLDEDYHISTINIGSARCFGILKPKP
jgi:hypothetical protein